MSKTTTSTWVWGCPPGWWMVGCRSLDYNFVSILFLATKRRLARSTKLWPPFKDGCAPSTTTTLKVMLAASAQWNGSNTSSSIRLLSAKHSLTMSRSGSEILLRRTSHFHLLALNVKLYLTSWMWSHATWCLTLLTLSTAMRTMMQRKMILHSAMTLSTMLYFADVFKKQHWQRSEHYHYFSAWIRGRRKKRAMWVILIRSLSQSWKLLYSNYLSDTCHAACLFGWRPTYWVARMICCTTLFCVFGLAMMSPTTSELCVLSTCNALLAICTVHGHFQLCWTLQLIKAPRISMCAFNLHADLL